MADYTIDILNEEIMETKNLNKYPASPKELLSNMKSFKYKNFTKLMSWEMVQQTKSGSCHDQVIYELHMFKQMNISANAVFLIELKNNSTKGGRTHSFVYYKDNNKYYWFENAWTSQNGIHGPYNSKKEIEKDIEDKMLKESDYDFVEFSSFKGKPGMTLQELVDSCMNN